MDGSLRHGALGEGSQSDTDTLTVGDLAIDPVGHTAQVGADLLALTPKEFDLLYHLAERPGRVWSRQQLVDATWTYPDVDPRVVTVHIGNLRRKLAAIDPAAVAVPHIQTVWNIGYRLTSVEAHAAHPPLLAGSAIAPEVTPGPLPLIVGEIALHDLSRWVPGTAILALIVPLSSLSQSDVALLHAACGQGGEDEQGSSAT